MNQTGDDPGKMFARIAKRRTPIATLLMDQSILAGIGNIYRAELLFRARLSPFRPGAEVGQPALEALWADACALMPDGMVDRRIVTTRREDRPHARGRALGEEAHYVYRRQGRPCFLCGTPIKTMDLGGRNLFWCPSCQAA